MPKAFLSVDFDEFNQESYRSFGFKIDDTEHRFGTGDPVIDWWNLLRFIEESAIETYAVSSMLDYFYSDGYTYVQSNLDVKNGCFIDDEQAYTEEGDLREDLIGVCNRNKWNYQQWQEHILRETSH